MNKYAQFQKTYLEKTLKQMVDETKDKQRILRSKEEQANATQVKNPDPILLHEGKYCETFKFMRKKDLTLSECNDLCHKEDLCGFFEYSKQNGYCILRVSCETLIESKNPDKYVYQPNKNSKTE